ncbi:hypothetical protein C4D60_Mb11t19520 [Musa balbisiana]|uniref:C2 NT-type domain-containing protein n=1 Tax=Musa balbisiana TaxID=52838 RepID=A0A4S8J5I3_MUSBA|nr:hypothetical protein C4D60_Mb11t19520 [Musa balbisiana]
MFKLHRYRSDRFGEKVEFKLSNLQAVKVPRGWDKLLISIVSVESGKTIARTGRATVRSGNCQWTETESIWVSQDDASKELEECRFKIVVSPASSRSVVIGEVTLNLADYLSSGETGPLLLPLKKCDSGTTLQDTSFSASGSRHSSDSGDCLSRTGLSPKNSLNGGQYIGRQDSSGSHISATCSTGPGGSNPSSFNSRASVSSVHNNQWQDMAAQTSEHGTMPSLRPSDSSKDLLESAEEMEELRDEVKMWERHSQQLKLDLELLKKENSEKSKHQNCVNEREKQERSRKSLENESEWERKVSLKEEETVKLESPNIVENERQYEYDGNHSDLIKEVEVLKSKVHELEQDCAELTEENLDLIFKLKEFSKDTDKGSQSHGSRSIEYHDHNLSNNCEYENGLLKSHIYEIENELVKKEVMTPPLSAKLRDLEKASAYLEKELQHYKDEASSFETKLHQSNKEFEEKNIELSNLQQKLNLNIDTDLEGLNAFPMKGFENEESFSSSNMQTVLFEMDKQTHLALAQARNLLANDSIDAENVCGSDTDSTLPTTDPISQKNLAEDITKNLHELNTLLRENIFRCNSMSQHESSGINQRINNTEAPDQLKDKETQKRLSEALEESDISRRSNLKLQATIENLIEECNSLQNLTGDLKRQKLELHERITRLEVDLNESKKKDFDFCDQIDLLELKLSSLQKDIGSKEKSLLSQLEKMFQDHKEHEDKIAKVHILLNRIELEITVEVENLEKEIADLTAQMSLNHDEREKVASDAIHEASLLRSEKARLECSLQEVNSKVELYETDLQALQQESKNKIQGLVDLLNASKQSEEMLMTDIEHMQRIMEGVKYSEEKYRKLVTDLELRLKTSDYEKQHAMEEISGLEVQLQKLFHLQNSVLDLKGSLDEADFEKRKLELLLESVKQESEELKAENTLLMEKVSSMQKALSDSQDDRRSKIALQEKLVRLESDLSVKEASYVYEAELKNELSRIKRTNSEYQRMFQNLEQENVELMNKVQNMEEELMLSKTAHQDEKISSEDDSNSCDHTEVPNDSKEVDHESDIPLHGTEHTEAGGVNNMHKEQLKRGISRKQADNIEALKKTLKENADKISSLETELKDMRERYLHMSLQYAEVEAQREELVMQLKSVKKEKRWFS